MFKLDLEKAEEPEVKLPTSAGSSQKQESSRKTSTSALLITKSLYCVDHNKLWKILKEMGYQTTLPASWEIYMKFRKQQLEMDIDQWTGSKLEKEYVKAVYCHFAYLMYL